MPAPACLLQHLRRSVLGAWFAAAYALAVLALALAPTSSAAFAGPDGILLCSGAAVPDDGTPGAPAPLGELAHCKGCPHNPVFAAPPPAVVLPVARMAIDRPRAPERGESRPQGFATGLPPSRAPPAA